MAIEHGQGRLPEERPDWGPKIRNFLTPRGTQALEKALSVYAPHTSDELDEDPAKKLTVAKEAHGYIEEVVADIVSRIVAGFTQKGRGEILLKDPIDILASFDEQILAKYEEYAIAGLRHSEAFIFNEIKERLQSYLLTLIALRERQHRDFTKKGRKSTGMMRGQRVKFVEEEHVHGGFFACLDRPFVISQFPPNERTKLSLLMQKFEIAKGIWIPLLKNKRGEIQNPTKLKTAEELRKENDRISRLLIANANRDTDQCTVENTTLFGGEHPLTMQFAPIDNPKLGIFHTAVAQVDFFEPEIGELFAQDKKRQDLLKVQRSAPVGGLHHDVMVQAGDYPPMFVGRFDGRIKGMNLDRESLKKINPFTYELIRRDILFYLAQLVCKRHTLQEMFGDTFAPREKAPAPPASKGLTTPDKPAPNPSTEVTRRYPQDLTDQSPRDLATNVFGALEEGRTVDISPEEGQEEIVPPEDVQEAVEDTVADVQRRAGPITPHRRLGRLIKTETKVIPTCPSKRAIALATAAGKELRKGGEFFRLGIVIHPDKVPQFLEDYRKKLEAQGETASSLTLEDLVAKYPDDFSVRYETWFSGGYRGNKEHGVIETIRAEVRKEI